MTFKAGDKVRYKNVPGFGSWVGLEGEVLEDANAELTVAKVTRSADGFSNDDYLNRVGSIGKFITKNLELIDPPFTFADIQVGDKIRRTLTRDTGTTAVREGTVVQKDGLYAMDAKHTGRVGDSYILAYSSDGDPAKPQVVLELLDRPKAPELWENREAGDKIVSYGKQGNLDRIFTKREDGGWDTLVVNTEGKIQKGYYRSERELSQYISKNEYTFALVK